MKPRFYARIICHISMGHRVHIAWQKTRVSIGFSIPNSTWEISQVFFAGYKHSIMYPIVRVEYGMRFLVRCGNQRCTTVQFLIRIIFLIMHCHKMLADFLKKKITQTFCGGRKWMESIIHLLNRILPFYT